MGIVPIEDAGADDSVAQDSGEMSEGRGTEGAGGAGWTAGPTGRGGDAGGFGDNNTSRPTDDGSSDMAGAASGVMSKMGSGVARVGFGMMAAGINGARSVGDTVGNLFKGALSGLMRAGAGLSGFTGGFISPMVGAGLVGGGGGVGVVMSLVMVASLLFPSPNREGAIVDECLDIFTKPDTSTAGMIDASAETEANAKTIYGVFSYLGMGDENIAGMLGNFSHESGIDPTQVETMAGIEKFQIGPQKQAAWDAGFKVDIVAPEYGARFPAIDLMGIGLGQWTNGRNSLLTSFADASGREWHDLELQLAFMIGADDPARQAQIGSMIANSNEGANSVNGATTWFMRQWEGISDGTDTPRQQAAGQWFAKMGSWDEDAELGESVLELADSGLSRANNKQLQNELEDCADLAAGGGNGSIAEAMATLSWPNSEEGEWNDGTDMYIWLHDQIFPGDPYYASCDRGVGTAVRWSGADDNFPPGYTGAQYEYMVGEGSDKWELVSDSAGNPDELLPGDVLMDSPNHVAMYLGNEVVQKVWGGVSRDPAPNLTADMAHASLNNRSPTLDNHYPDLERFKVFRNTGPEGSSEYKNLQVPASMKPGVGDKDRHTTPSLG